MKKTSYTQSSKCKNFYKAVKNAVAKKFNVLPTYVGIVANSASYPDSVSISTDTFMNSVIAFIQYDSNNSVIGQYALAVEDVMKMFNQMLSDSKTIVAKSANGIDQLTRIDWAYLKNYSINI